MPPAPVMGQGRGALSGAATLVAHARHDFDALDRALVQHLDTARAQWAGEGGRAFTALGLAWSEKQRAIVGALDLFAQALDSTERDNATTDVDQAASFARCRQRLG